MKSVDRGFLLESRGRRRSLLLYGLVGLGTLIGVPGAVAQELSPNAIAEMRAMLLEKASRTPAERKLDTSLLMAARQSRGETMVKGIDRPFTRTASRAGVDERGMAVVDIKAEVTTKLRETIVRLGGELLLEYPAYQSVRARLPIREMEALAALPEVRHIGPRERYLLNVGAATSEGDVAHVAATTRSTYGINGTGIKVGVLSDGVDTLAARQASGDLGTVTVVPGQAGSGDEGTAMLEIVHDLAPGAELFFATAFNGVASFASNIQTLRTTYSCDVIVDDVTYLDEGAFQDGPIAQAVNTVTSGGALYLSSAGNSGNLKDGTSGTWEGDFVDSGTSIPVLAGAGTIHAFSGSNNDELTANSPFITLKWSDALSASGNDYDLFLLNSSLTSVYDYSTNTQSGTQDPLEWIAPAPPNSYAGYTGERIVVVLYSGAARALRLDTNRGRLAIATDGAIVGHNGAESALSVAAVAASTAGGGAFSGGVSNPVETYSSDGPRHMFYNPDGSAITPGNLLFGTGGGESLQKPDITAADCVTTTTPGFIPFCGTSAAAPHAGAIAAVLRSLPSAPSSSEVKTALMSTALDIEATGTDRDSGVGIVMANIVRLLSVSKTGAGTGTVTSSPAGISCGGDCSEPYLHGKVVTLSAVADGGSTFTGWSGGGCSGTGTCVVTMDAAKTVTASFGIAVLPPTITGFTPTSGPVGTSVAITGTNFTGATAVAFNGTSAGYTVNSATSITATVPSGATTGPISVTTPGGTVVSADSFVVTQPCSVSIVPSSASYGTAGGQGSVDVYAGTTCSWTATSDDPGWLTVTSGSPSTGNGTVTYEVAVNPAGARTGTIDIGGQTFTVTQQAAACSYAISPTSAFYGAGGGSGTAIVATVAGCAWSATVDASAGWLSITSGASGTGPGTIDYTVLPSAGACIREGALVVAGQTLTVTQQGTASLSWDTTGSLAEARSGHVAVRLTDGRVLVAGGRLGTDYSTILSSAEIFDPSSGTWSPTGSMSTPRDEFAGVLLPDGRVLVMGGWSGTTTDTALASAEIYDPSGGTWHSVPDMTYKRPEVKAVVLYDGRALAVGGRTTYAAFTTEAFDPFSETWTIAGWMAEGYFGHTATLLRDGRVLIAGSQYTDPSSAEVFDPATGVWQRTGSLNAERWRHGAALLPDGRVLVSGGQINGGSSEVYDPATGAWAMTGGLNNSRSMHASVVLPDGSVVVAGWSGTTPEVYSPAAGTWTTLAAGPTDISSDPTATLLRDGRVLVVGASACYILNASSPLWLAPRSDSFPIAGGAGSASVTAPAACAWRAVSMSAWLALDGASSGSGNGSVSYSVAPSGGLARAGSIAVGPEVAFVLQRNRPLAVTKLGSGAGTVYSTPPGIDCGTTCDAEFPSGTIVTLTAVPDPVSTFLGWSGAGCTDTGTCTVAMDSAKSVTAEFGVRSFVLNVSNEGSGTGTVTSSPPGINCGTTCAHSYEFETTVSLTATAAGGSFFGGWSGDECDGTAPCAVTMTTDKSVTATFATCTYALDPTTASLAAAGGSGTLAVVTQTGCDWAAVSNDAWITITGAASGSGGGTVGYSVAANAGPLRTGTVSVAGQTFTIAQATSGPPFTEVAAGLPAYLYDGAVAWGDYDNDGDLDAVLAGGGDSAEYYMARVYRNDGVSGFTDVGAGLSGVDRGSVDWGDYDRDGGLDILLTGFNGSEYTTRLYHNDGGSVFHDVATDLPGVASGKALWGDYDNDGDLDILITGYSAWGAIARVYRNDDGSFTDIGAGLPGVYYGSADWGDYDNDGDLDILLSTGCYSCGFLSTIFRNDGAGIFTDIGGLPPHTQWTRAAWADYDNDGDLDVLITGLTGEFITRLYRNDGAGALTDVGAGLAGVFGSSQAWVDYDNDGDLDIALAGDTTYPSPVGDEITKLYRNDAGTFIDVPSGLPAVSGFDGPMAWGDYDNDGDLDLLLGSRLFRNDGAGANGIAGAPTNLISPAAAGRVTLSWSAPSDPETPVAGLTYNLRVGTSASGSDVVAPMAAPSGYRRKPAVGNTEHGTTAVLEALAPGDYHWSVQAVDTGLAGSPFSDEGTFTVCPNGSVNPSTESHTDGGGTSTVMVEAGAGCTWSAASHASWITFPTGATGSGNGSLTYSVAPNSGPRRTGLVSVAGALLTVHQGCAYSLDPPSASPSAAGGPGSVGVSSIGVGCSWEATSNVSWITVTSGSSGGGDGTVGYVVEPTTGPARSGTITIAGQMFTVNQASGCAWTLTPPGASPGGLGGTGRINLSTTDGCVWSAVSNDTWATITSGTSGTHSGAIYYSVAPNPDLTPRSGTMTIADQTFVVQQAPGSFSEAASFFGTWQGSVAWGDYDNDGDLDILQTGAHDFTLVASIHRNDGGGVFTDIDADLPPIQNSAGVWGDYDNDGDLDIALAGTASGLDIVRIFRNDGGGAFVDIDAGMSGSGIASLAWGDYDNDGRLDLLVDCSGGTKLYRNKGDGAFGEVPSGLPSVEYGMARWGDYDGDGDLDILFSGADANGQFSRVYRNDGQGSFSDIDAGLAPSYGDAGATWGDYDNDGDLDILLPRTGAAYPDYAAKLYRNDGGAFVETAVSLPGWYKAAAWGDYDNDGDSDLALLAGWDGAAALSQVFRNDGGGVFTDVGVGLPSLSSAGNGSVAWGDYDNDGDLDLMVTGWLGPDYMAKLYRNNGDTTNTAPAAPAGLAALVDPEQVELSWAPASDAQTPAAGLTYNLRVGTSPGGSNLLDPMAASDGYRRLPAPGNAGHGTTALFVPSAVGTHYWSVQAVDAEFAGSGFAVEGTFTVTTLPPTITSFTPASGPAGTSVAITGTHLTGATAVAFNGTAATGYTVASDTSITATVPSGATTGPISVTTGGGTATLGTFTVIPAPMITSVTPPSGPVGTSVSITGTGFTGATSVAFNGTSASYTVNSATSITATVPSGATTGPISVTTPGGTGTSASSFTVIPAPTISSFTPTSGPVGASVAITGTGFTAATVVAFNGNSASYTVNSATSISATVPSGATTGPISVTTSGGTATSASSFTVIPAPTITGFTPTSGPVGTSVAISGTNFTGATAVSFNGTSASYVVNSATSITATVPLGATTGPISVTTAGGTATSASGYTVIPPPTITGFTPTSGPVGTSVAITGTDFTGASAVAFNGTSASYTVNSATSITATVPSGATTGPISVTTPGGTATSAADFTVVALCTSFTISPTSVSVPYSADSQVVTITGVPAGCGGGEWTTAGNGSWITVSPASGTGSGSATVSWDENPGVPRSDEATIAGETFTVVQGSPNTDYFTLTPCRVVNTRLTEPLVFDEPETFQISGECGVPATATAVAFNMTVVDPTALGNCRLYPDPSQMPQVSTINYAAGQTRGNNAIVPLLSPDGTVTVRCVGADPGTIDVILDVFGYFDVTGGGD